MAAASQYNLRKTVRLPVNLQGDAQFLEELLAGEASKTKSGISDDSFSSLDCDALVDDSDSDIDIASAQKCTHQDKYGQSTSGVYNTENMRDTDNTDINTRTDSGTDMQSNINAEILKQLQKLGNRLDAIEKGKSKKTKDAWKVKGKSRKKYPIPLPEALSSNC